MTATTTKTQNGTYNDVITGVNNIVKGFGDALKTGDALEINRRAWAEEDGINQAYDYIAQKAGGLYGDLSALDDDPIMNTRYGMKAMGKYANDRLSNAQNRLGLLKNNMEQFDTMYQQQVQPLAAMADDAYQRGDMQMFQQYFNALSQVCPVPYYTSTDGDGNFTVNFRSSQAGGYVPSGTTLTPEQAYNYVRTVRTGEQQVLNGATMQVGTVNPMWASAMARYKMATAQSNAAALQDETKWLEFRDKKGNTVYAVPQNRHDNYSIGPSYRVLDEKNGRSYMVGSIDELGQMGFTQVPKTNLAIYGNGKGRVGSKTGVAQSGLSGTGGQSDLTKDDDFQNVLYQNGWRYDSKLKKWFSLAKDENGKIVYDDNGKEILDYNTPLTKQDIENLQKIMQDPNDPLNIRAQKGKQNNQQQGQPPQQGQAQQGSAQQKGQPQQQPYSPPPTPENMTDISMQQRGKYGVNDVIPNMDTSKEDNLYAIVGEDMNTNDMSVSFGGGFNNTDEEENKNKIPSPPFLSGIWLYPTLLRKDK